MPYLVMVIISITKITVVLGIVEKKNCKFNTLATLPVGFTDYQTSENHQVIIEFYGKHKPVLSMVMVIRKWKKAAFKWCMTC